MRSAAKGTGDFEVEESTYEFQIDDLFRISGGVEIPVVCVGAQRVMPLRKETASVKLLGEVLRVNTRDLQERRRQVYMRAWYPRYSIGWDPRTPDDRWQIC